MSGSGSDATKPSRSGYLSTAAAPSSLTARHSCACSAAVSRNATPGEEIDSTAAAMPTSSIIATASATSHCGRAGIPSG